MQRIKAARIYKYIVEDKAKEAKKPDIAGACHQAIMHDRLRFVVGFLQGTETD